MEMEMEMGSGLPSWLDAAAWGFLGIAVLSAVIIAAHILLRGSGRPKRLSDVLWPLSALYLGPLAIPIYLRYGRARGDSTPQQSDGLELPRTEVAVRSGVLGGVASGLAHLVAVPFVVVTGLTIAGVDMWAMVAIITVLATLSIFAAEYFYFTSRDRRKHGMMGVTTALVAATVTVLAFDIGMLGWMLILFFSETMPTATDIRFTLLMQIGLVLGTVTAFPVVRWLVGRARIAEGNSNMQVA